MAKLDHGPVGMSAIFRTRNKRQRHVTAGANDVDLPLQEGIVCCLTFFCVCLLETMRDEEEKMDVKGEGACFGALRRP